MASFVRVREVPQFPRPLCLLFAALSCAVVVTAQSLEPVNRNLPDWIHLGGEYRVRYEGFDNRGYSDVDDDHYLLQRYRMDLRLKPAKHFQIVAQAQDSRVFFNTRISDAPPFRDTLDLRLAYAQVGDPEKGHFAVRVGRQEISIGEERLLGSANWGNTARSFDAARVYWRPLAKARFDVFAASVVAQSDGAFDRHVDGDNLHGAIGQINWHGAHFEPFGLWRVAPRGRSESGRFGKVDTKTFGTRVTGKLNPRTDYVMELIGQNGKWGPDSLRAWAGHWRVVRTLAKDRRVPRLRIEYDYATGDSNPTDGRHETFELIYPTPHDKLGLADQVGWKNVHHLSAVGEWLPSKLWTVQMKYHEWWLASATDGVYTAGGALIARNSVGTAGRHIGHELDLQALGSVGKQMKLGGGVGHIFPGEFLHRTTPSRDYTFPYVMMTWSF